MFEVRDWVQRVAGRTLASSDDALAWLSERDPSGNWSIQTGNGGMGLHTGDQWVFASDDPALVEACALGVAIGLALVNPAE